MNKKELDFINKNQLVSFMNKTKWRQLAVALTSNKNFKPKIKLQYLDDNIKTAFSFLDWEWIIYGETACIRTMEIDPIKRIYQGHLINDNKTCDSHYSIYLQQETHENVYIL